MERGDETRTQATGTPSEDLRPRRGFVGDVTDEELDAAYDALSDRHSLIGGLLNKARGQRGLPPYGDVELLMRIADSDEILADVPTWALSECFRRAVIEHRQDDPFGVNEVARIWFDLSETTKTQLFEKSRERSLPPGPPCTYCNNTGLMRVRSDGEPVRWESLRDTNTRAKCICRKARTVNVSAE